MIGADTSSIALRVASIGDSPSSMCRSTFSTTTIASSTTMPIARTRPKSDSVLSEKPKASITANVPMIDTGTATSGMIDARQVCRKTSTTITTRRMAMNSVSITAAIDSRTIDRRVVDDAIVDAFRKRLLQRLHRRAHLRRCFDGVAAGPLEDADRRGRLVVEQAAQRVVARAQLDAADVLAAA